MGPRTILLPGLFLALYACGVAPAISFQNSQGDAEAQGASQNTVTSGSAPVQKNKVALSAAEFVSKNLARTQWKMQGILACEKLLDQPVYADTKLVFISETQMELTGDFYKDENCTVPDPTFTAAPAPIPYRIEPSKLLDAWNFTYTLPTVTRYTILKISGDRLYWGIGVNSLDMSTEEKRAPELDTYNWFLKVK